MMYIFIKHMGKYVQETLTVRTVKATLEPWRERSVWGKKNSGLIQGQVPCNAPVLPPSCPYKVGT